MPKIKHIAMTAKDPHKVAAFYMELFGMEEVGRSGDSHVYLSDGEMNLTIRSCKAAGDADVGEGGAGFEGIHHIGFVVDDVEEYSEKALKIGAKMLSPAKAVAAGATSGGGAPFPNILRPRYGFKECLLELLACRIILLEQVCQLDDTTGREILTPVAWLATIRLIQIRNSLAEEHNST